jgi:signal transduction histidine kinase
MFYLYLLLLGLSIVANIVLIYLLYRHGQKNTTHVSLMILLLLVTIWFTPKFLSNILNAQDDLFTFFSQISALGYIFIPATFLVFSLAYAMLYKVFMRFYFWIFILLPSIIFLYLSWTSNLIGIHDFHLAQAYPWGYETPTGKLWSIYIFWFDGIMLLSDGILFYNYSQIVDKVKKRQALMIVILLTIPLIIGTITNGILPLFHFFIFPIGLILLNLMAIVGITLIYRYGWAVVTPMSILSSIKHTIITVDNKGTIIQMNPSAERVLLIRELAGIGKPLDNLIMVKEDEKKQTNQLMKLLRTVLEKGKSITYDNYLVINSKKQIFPFILSITPIYSQNSIIGANVFMLDRKKELEKEKQKDDLFGVLSHELKTPLTSLKAYTQILSKQSLSTEKSKKLLSQMEYQIDRLGRLIQDSFEVSRVHAGKLQLEKEYFGIDDLIIDIVQTMNVTYKNRKIVIDGRTNCVVFADKGKIEQIVINLINNAIRYSLEERPIFIHLLSDNKNVSVSVEDFGKGIPLKYHKKIFERFFQVNGQSGLGMGLFIASTILKAHNGRIWVESKVNKGSIFTFSLPISH